MNETLILVLAFIAGVALGIIFFGGLWLTVKKMVNATMPGLWVLGSFALRMGIVLTAFYFIGAGNWQRLMTCLLGFIMARFLVIYYTKPIDAKQLKLKKEDMNGA